VNRNFRIRLLVLSTLPALASCGGERAKEEKSPPPAEARGPSPTSNDMAVPPGEIASQRPSPLEAKLLPPKAVIGSDPDPRAPALTFQTREEPGRLLDWFRATGNGTDFVLETEMQEGAEYVFSGRARESGEVFTIRVAPGANGGTTGILLVAPR
jgi:hypothetical protein